MTTEKLLEAIGMISDELIAEAKETRRTRSTVKWLNKLPLAAIIIVLLTVTALAASGVLTGILDLLRRETHGRLSQEQEMSIQEDILYSGQTETIDGVSITLNEVYGDGTNFMFYLSVDGPKVKELEEIHIKRIELILEGEEEHSESTLLRTLDDADPTDDHKDIILRISRTFDGTEMSQETITGTLKLVDLIDRTNIDPIILEQQGILNAAETVAAGEWSFNFELGNGGVYQEMRVSGITLEGNAALNKVYMAAAEVESITLRMLSMEMKYRTDPEHETLQFESPVIILEDGSEIILLEKFGGRVPDPDGSNAGRKFVTYIAEGPVMLEKVAAIRFGELVIPWQPTA